MSKVFILQNHCRDKAMNFIVNQYPGIMAQLNTADFDTLPFNLTLQEAFKHIMENITDVVTTREEYVKTNAKLLMLSFQASDNDGVQNHSMEVTKTLRRLAVLNNGKPYDNELLVAQCQSRICDSGICKQELRKIDKEWARDDKAKDPDTIFEQFKTYYITETTILAADEVQGTTNRVNSAMEQMMTNLEATVSKLCIDNSVLMANQGEMASAYKNSGVPTKISTGGGGGMSVAPGTDLTGYIGQILDERKGSNSSRTTGGDKSRDTK